MGFTNPAMPWSELEARLSNGRAPSTVSWNGGGDGPAFGAKRQEFEPSVRPRRDAVPYAELHARSSFSFLQGAAHPEQLAECAAALGLHALALTDRNGLYGVVRFAEAARELRHALKGRVDDDALRQAARALHRAFDRTFGQTLFAAEIDRFCAKHQAFAPHRERMERFFAWSRRLFFETGGAEDPRAPEARQALLELASGCEAAERRTL